MSLLPSIVVFLFLAHPVFFLPSPFCSFYLLPLTSQIIFSFSAFAFLISFSSLFNLYPFTHLSSCSFWGRPLRLFLALWRRRRERVALTHPPTLIISLRWLSEHTAITKAAMSLLLPTYIWICMHVSIHYGFVHSSLFAWAWMYECVNCGTGHISFQAPRRDLLWTVCHIWRTVQRILMKGAAGMDFIVLVCIRSCQMFTDHCFMNASVYIFQSAVMYGTNNISNSLILSFSCTEQQFSLSFSNMYHQF